MWLGAGVDTVIVKVTERSSSEGTCGGEAEPLPAAAASHGARAAERGVHVAAPRLRRSKRTALGPPPPAATARGPFLSPDNASEGSWGHFCHSSQNHAARCAFITVSVLAVPST